VAAEEGGLAVVDVTNPTGPSLAGGYAPPEGVNDVQVAGDHAYLACRFDDFRVLDITDPTAPALAGSCAVSGVGQGVTVVGDYAYVAALSGGFHVVDITDPTAPAVVASRDPGHDVYHVGVAGDLSYVAVSGEGIRVYDVTDPTNPVFLGLCPLSGTPRSLSVAGDHVFAANSDLQVVEVAQRVLDPSGNTGRSLEIDAADAWITRARLTDTSTPVVAWELSANGGGTWEPITADGSWHVFAASGDDLRWRATLAFAGSEGPAVDDVTVEWEDDWASTPDGLPPAALELHPPRPNPFARECTVGYGVPAGGGTVLLRVFDAAGRAVRTLVDRDEPGGVREIAWDGCDEGGTAVASGIYFVRLEAGDAVLERRAILLK